MDNVYDILVQLKANVNEFKSGMAEAQTSIREFESVTGTQLDKVGTTLAGLGGAFTKGITVPVTAAAIAAGKAGMDMETAMTGVAKTTDLTAEELALMKSEIKGLSEEMPIAATEIAGVAEAAGQLGIEKQNIISFTESMVGLGTATDMSSEEAATALARLANITGMPQTEFDKLGSTIVELGNNMAATESEIVNMSLRLAGTGAQVGLTEAEILGLSGAMTSMGINAEAGGSAMSQTMQHINTEVLGSGENLQALADIAGMTASEFSETWRNDPMKAIEMFVGGLGEVSESGGDVAGVLDDAGIKGLRQVDVLSRLSGGSELLASAIGMSTDAWDENTALQDEVAAATDTTAARMQMLWNKIVNLAESIGSILLPMIDDMIDKIAQWVDWFANLDQSTQETIVQVALFAAKIGPVLVVVGKLIGVISSLYKAFKNFKTFMAGLQIFAKLKGAVESVQIAFMYLQSGGIKGLIGAMNPLTLKIAAVIAIIGALVAAGVWLYQNWDTVKEKAAQLGEWLGNTWNNIKTWTSETWESISTSISEAVSNAWNAIVEWFGNLPVWFSETWTNISTTISEKASEIWNSITTWFGQIPGFFSELWTTVVTAVTEWASNMVTKASETGSKFLENIMNFFDTLPERLGYAIGWALASVAVWVVEMVTKAYELGSTFIANVMEWFSQLPERIGNFLSTTWDRVSTWAVDMWTKAKEMGSNFINSVIEWFSQLPGRVWNWVVNTYNRVSTWASNMWSKAKEMGANFINAVISYFSQLPGRVWNWVVNTYNRVSTWASNMWTKAKETGSRFITNIINWFQQLPGRVQTWLTNTISRAANFVRDLGRKGLEAGRDFMNKLISKAREIPGKIFNIGKDIVRGAWNGIKSMGNWIWGNVTDFFGGLVDGVKDRLSIFSPSRVFRDEIGKMIVRGLGIGIERNEDDAVNPMQHLINSVLGAWDSVGALSAQVDGMVGHTVTKNVNMKNDYTAQPAYITLVIGGRSFRAFVEDITNVQDGNTELELEYA